MLEGIIIQLPDGTTMTLSEFNDNVNSGVIDVSDAGWILPDGSVLPTKGEPLFGAYPEEMIALMQPYIVRDGDYDATANGEPADVDGAPPPRDWWETMRFDRIAIVGIIIYLIVKNKK